MPASREGRVWDSASKGSFLLFYPGTPSPGASAPVPALSKALWSQQIAAECICGGAQYTPGGLFLFNDPVFATIPKYNKYLIDERRIRWYCELVELLCGVPTYPQAEVVVEMIDGELYEVGGNWRAVRRKVRERLAEMEADEA